MIGATGRAVLGDPEKVPITYRIDGSRRLEVDTGLAPGTRLDIAGVTRQ
jgi:hypothetical protein